MRFLKRKKKNKVAKIKKKAPKKAVSRKKETKILTAEGFKRRKKAGKIS